MLDLNALGGAFDLLTSSFSPWLVVLPGLIIGLAAGAIPGVSGSMAMAVLLPLTAYMDFLSAMLFLTSIFTGAGFGCAIPAILINIPGTPAAVATAFDGYPMAQKGLHNEALGLGLGASVAGQLVGYVVLLLAVGPASYAVLKMGPLEMSAVAIWGLTLIGMLRGRHVGRGLLAGIVGVLIGTVGTNAAGYSRGTMGYTVLLDGFPVIPAMMGLFVSSQLFALIGRESYIVKDEAARVISVARIWSGFRESFRHPGILIKGSLIGCGVGIVPGVGSSISNLLSYAQTRRSDPNPESFGKGNPKGVMASESANSSSEGGSMATLLALGIPGGAGTAVMLSAFAMHNINGGPRFITDHRDIVYGIIIGNFWQAVLLAVVGIGFVYFAAAIVKLPVRYLVPTVMVLGAMGSYALTGSSVGPVTLFIFSILGWLLTRFDYSVPAMVVGLVLGFMLESELLRTYQISGGDPSYLLKRPAGTAMLALLVLTATAPLLKSGFRRYRAATQESPG
ncbi:tripartite tricarboxylate transporter permease [Propylenella binzhouense]|uniref:DUF112 domain-containing protein n=1 Tax=Propylenella binzhouense TaxID=2555902 RepID=A0A964T1C8_9HYPH|nr:hypothetical protein [Propylenella binzhouense]